MTLKYRSTARKRSQNKCPKMIFGAFISDPVLHSTGPEVQKHRLKAFPE